MRYFDGSRGKIGEVVACLHQHSASAWQTAAEYFSGGVQYPPMGMKRMFWRSRSEITEEVENGTPVSIEPSRPRRRMKLILTLALSGALGGFLISYVFPARYTSQSTVLVEGQKIPDEYVHPLITGDFTQRIQTVSQEVVSPSKLRGMIEGPTHGYPPIPPLVKPEEEDKLISHIQQNMTIEPVFPSFSEAPKASPTGFTVTYVDSDPARAQQICAALTEAIVNENLKSRAEVAQSTVEFLGRQLDDAKKVLDDQDAKLADFKKKQMGQLPTDSRTAMSPIIEEQYKLLTRDNNTNEASYKDLLGKFRSAQLSEQLENQQMGEQMNILATANLPESPDFPNRTLFALGGLGLGLILGIGRALWPSRKVKAE